MYIKTMGEGPPLVLLHGWGLHGEIWASVCDALAQDYQLHLVDLPGFGRSNDMPDDYQLASVSEYIMTKLPSPAHIIGWSLGGLIAQYIASHFPQQVLRLITVASSPCFVRREGWECAMLPNVLATFSEHLQQDYQSTLKRFLAIQTMGSETARVDIKWLRDQLFAHGEPQARALRDGLTILMQADLREDITKISVPWLRIYGRLDGLVPVKSAALTDDWVPQSKSVIFAKASHAPFISHPQQFVEYVQGFLAQ